ncbi:replicative DNA helicase [Parabacteroides goldsteinii]
MKEGVDEQKDLTLSEVENTLVCCLLTSVDAPGLVSTLLHKEMFSDAALGFVFQAVMNLYEQGVQPDMVSVETEMRRMDEARWKELNGLSFLLTAMLNVRHGGNVQHYAQEIKRQYMLRCLAQLFVLLNIKSSCFDADPEAVISEAEDSLLKLWGEVAGSEPIRPVGVLAAEAVAWHRERLDGSYDRNRIRSGLAEFDYVTGGFHKGELSVLAGHSSDGKTAVALHIAVQAARAGKHVCLFSLEMSNLQMLNRILAGVTDVDPDHLRISGLTVRELEVLEKAGKLLEHLPLYIDYKACNTLSDIRSKVMLKSKKGECDFVILDYLHLLSSIRQKNETQEQVVGRNITALKQLALDTDCPVLVVSQVNRASDQRVDKAHIPVMSDLRDSGTIEQVADCVFFVYRPERYGIVKDERTGEDLKGVGKLYIVKNRNGATGIARFRYNASYTKITDY